MKLESAEVEGEYLGGIANNRNKITDTMKKIWTNLRLLPILTISYIVSLVLFSIKSIQN